ncbi:MAG: hypothetical protein ACD_7C00077G0009 [uncultured bacterium]|nr:MAG: hypothetical protein ACD_7C00077G0009 [uncultured bacterium]
MSRKFTSKKIFKVLAVCAIAILLILWNPNNFFSGVRGFFMGVTLPVQKFLSAGAAKTHSFGQAIYSIGKIKKENKYLMEENLKLRAQNAKFADIMKENEDLRNQLKISSREEFDLEPARIIGKDIYNNDSWILIDKGRKNGIEKGMSVIVADGILVGKIKEVFDSTARVVFITEKLMNINVETVETGAVGIAKGDYGLGLIMDLVLQTDSLKIGDRVITSDISQDVPRGLLVGEIREINSAQNDLFQKAVISLPVDFFKLRFVFVIKNTSH